MMFITLLLLAFVALFALIVRDQHQRVRQLDTHLRQLIESGDIDMSEFDPIGALIVECRFHMMGIRVYRYGRWLRASKVSA